MRCEESPVICLSLLPTREGAQAVVVSVPPKTLAFWTNVTLFQFISPTSVVFLQIFPLLNIIEQAPLLISCFSQRPNYHMTFLLILITFRTTTFTHDSASKEESVSTPTSTRLLYALWTSNLQTLMSSGLRFVSRPSLSFSVSLTALPILQTLFCHEAITSEHPQAEFFHLRDFNVHHREWFKSSHTDVGGVEALAFSSAEHTFPRAWAKWFSRR